MVGFEKALGAVKVIKDQIQYRSRSLLNIARGYFSFDERFYDNFFSQKKLNIKWDMINALSNPYQK